VVDYWTNVGFLPTYIRHRQLRPTLARCECPRACTVVKLRRDLYRRATEPRLRGYFPVLAADGFINGRHSGVRTQNSFIRMSSACDPQTVAQGHHVNLKGSGARQVRPGQDEPRGPAVRQQ